MDQQDLEYIKSCAKLLQSISDHTEIMEILERLKTVSISIETLKSTRIGIIVNKLTKREDLPTNIQQYAWELVNEWKEIATASAQKEHYIQQHRPRPNQNNHNNHNQPPPNHTNTNNTNTNPQRRRRKRPLSTMLDTDTPSTSNTSSTSSNSNSNKRQRTMTNSNSNRNKRKSQKSSMFAGVGGDKKMVPSLQQICVRVMKQNAMSLGHVPYELNKDLVHQIYGSLKPSELKKIYKVNPHLRIHLDGLWRRQLLRLDPMYQKADDTISWFKEYQNYLIKRKRKLESAKSKLLDKTEHESYNKTQARIFTKNEATAFKQRAKLMNQRNRMRFKSSSSGLSKRNRMMKDCMDFVNRRNRMFQTAAIKNKMPMGASYSKKQSFVRRQKEIRAKRQADKNRLLQW